MKRKKILRMKPCKAIKKSNLGWLIEYDGVRFWVPENAIVGFYPTENIVVKKPKDLNVNERSQKKLMGQLRWLNQNPGQKGIIEIDYKYAESCSENLTELAGVEVDAVKT